MRRVPLRTTVAQPHREHLGNKETTHQSCPVQGGWEAGMLPFNSHLPLAEGCSPGVELPTYREKPSGYRQGVTRVSIKVALYWIIPECPADVGRTPMAVRYTFLDFLSKITHTPSLPFPLPLLSFSSVGFLPGILFYLYLFIASSPHMH